MPIAVSQPFKDAVDDVHKLVVIQEIRVKRRKKAAGYPLEAGEIILEENEFKAVSPLVKKFDVQKQNKILVSNLTLSLDNCDFRWNEQNNTDGIWRPDAGSAGGYDPYLSEWTVIFSVVISDDIDAAPESIQVFVGRAVDFNQDTKSGIAQYFLKGLEIKLQTVDSQKVNTILTNSPTNPAAGDGSNPTFELAPSLFDVQKIRVAAADRIQGIDFKLSRTNDADLPAIATFEAGSIPPGTDPVDFTARQWKRGLTVSAFLGLICDAAGITPVQRAITEPNYPATSQFIEFGTQAEWDAATKVDTDSVFNPDKLTLGRALDGTFETGTLTGWNTASGVGPNVIPPNANGPFAGAWTGLWKGDMGIGASSGSGVAEVRLGTTVPVPGQFGSFIAGDKVRTVLPDSAWANTQVVVPGGVTSPLFLTFTIWWSSNQSIYSQISTVISTKKAQTITFKYFMGQIGFPISPNFNRHLQVDDVRMLEITSNGTGLSTEIDFGVIPVEMQPLLIDALLNGGTISAKTQSSVSSGGPYSPLVAVDGSNTPVSPLRQFWKVELTLNSNVGETDGPVVDFFKIQFLSTNLLIGHADTTQKDGFKTVQRLAEITGSEYGFDNTGKFFFRPKTVGLVPVLSLSQDNYILDVIPAKPGFKEVKNVIQVTYGPYYEEANSTTKGETFPNNSQERFGDLILPLSVNDFLFANNANFAGAIAELLFDLLSRPKRRARVICRLIPYLDLSDVISVSYSDSELTDPVFGDKLNPHPTFGPSGNVLYRNMIAKIIGIEHDFENGRTNIDIEEVLS